MIYFIGALATLALVVAVIGFILIAAHLHDHETAGAGDVPTDTPPPWRNVRG